MEPNNPIQPPVFNQPAQQPQYQQPQYPQQPYYGLPQMKPQMGFVEAIKTVLIEKYCCFKGRARRSEFWWWMLAYFLFNTTMTIIYIISMFLLKDDIIADTYSLYESPANIITMLVSWSVFLPLLGVTVRRLHDTGHSGWWVLVPVISSFLPMLWALSYLSMLMSSNSKIFMVSMGITAVSSLFVMVLLIIILVWLCHDSDPQENEYGPSPKYQ